MLIRTHNSFPTQNMAHLLDDPYTPYELDLAHPPVIPPVKPSPPGVNPGKYFKLMALRPFLPPVIVLDGLARLLGLPTPVYTLWRAGKGSCYCDVEVGEWPFLSTTLRDLEGDAMYDAARFALDVVSRDPTIIPYGNTTRGGHITDYVSALYVLCRRNGWKSPEFKYEGPPFEDGWRCDVEVDLGDWIYESKGVDTFRQRYEAKEDAAMAAYESLTELIRLT